MPSIWTQSRHAFKRILNRLSLKNLKRNRFAFLRNFGFVHMTKIILTLVWIGIVQISKHIRIQR